MVPYEHVLGLALLLFGLSLAGVLLRRSLLALLVGIEGLFVAVALALVGFARLHAHARVDAVAEAQGFALVVLVVAAAQFAVGLALVVAFVRKRGSANVESASVLRW